MQQLCGLFATAKLFVCCGYRSGEGARTGVGCARHNVVSPQKSTTFFQSLHTCTVFVVIIKPVITVSVMVLAIMILRSVVICSNCNHSV